MSIRTSQGAVSGILQRDWDGKSSLLPYIQSASAIVDRAVTLSKQRILGGISANEAELVERWLAAHLYVMSDQTYASKNTEGASASFQGKTGMGFEASKYGQTAVQLDFSGSLNAIGKRLIAKAFWPGTIPTNCPPLPDPGVGAGPY